MKLRMVAVAGAAMLALAGCNGGGGDNNAEGHPSATPSGRHVSDSTALVEAAKCMRANGFPDFPDPVEDPNQGWVIPNSAAGIQPPQACVELFRKAKGFQPRQPVTAADLVQLRKWATCIRTNGVPDWPDPDADGRFHQPTRLQPPDNDAAYAKAYEACLKEEPANGAIQMDGGPPK